MALDWVMYSDGKRQFEAFDEALRYNIEEVSPSCFGLLVRRMDDPVARHTDVLSSIDEAKAVAEKMKPEDVTRPQPKKEIARGNLA